MKKTCLYCGKVTDENYRVNEYGDVFCDDDCYDRFYESHECNEQLSNCLENWENDLNVDPEWNNLQHHADDIFDKINEVYEAYGDFLTTEEDDGVFAREIYLYLCKFQDFHK